MNVLIIDDDARKQDAIRKLLTELGVESADIMAVQDAAAARRLLVIKRYDLVLLDVLLPARAGEIPSGETSLDLLRQLVEDGTLKIPRHIVAMTADESALHEHAEEFRALTTQVLRVDPSSDAWKGSLKIVVEICKSGLHDSDFDFDVCVQTALRTPEFDAVIDAWPASWSEDTQISKGIVVRFGRLKVGDRVLKVACAHASTMGLVAATDMAGKIIHRLRPRVLLMTGICGGIGVDIGDVVVAEKAWDWQSGKFSDESGFQSGVDQKDASQDLVAHARILEGQLSMLESSWRGGRPDARSKLHIAPMVSGSSVIADSGMHERLVSQHRKIAAVDMEAYGVYFSAHMAGGMGPKVICIKGVSDLADSEKKDWAQPYGSFLSASLGRLVIEREFSSDR